MSESDYRKGLKGEGRGFLTSFFSSDEDTRDYERGERDRARIEESSKIRAESLIEEFRKIQSEKADSSTYNEVSYPKRSEFDTWVDNHEWFLPVVYGLVSCLGVALGLWLLEISTQFSFVWWVGVALILAGGFGAACVAFTIAAFLIILLIIMALITAVIWVVGYFIQNPI